MISSQFGLDFDKPYRVGIITVDRQYGINLEQDEHIYEYYSDCLNREVGVDEERIPEMAADAMKSGNIAVNPRSTTIDDIEVLYRISSRSF